MRVCLAFAGFALICVLRPSIGFAQAERACQMDPSGWCPSEKDDTCGRNRFAWACKLDPDCYGVAYLGESVIACKRDERGFGINCPTVGCTSRKPKE
jgi:hypothetical protein